MRRRSRDGFRLRDRGEYSNAVSAIPEERRGTARYLQALAQHWPFIVGSIALAVATAAAYLQTAESRYEARADILVAAVSASDDAFVGIPVIRETGESRGVLTAAYFVRTPQVADAVRRRLRPPMSRDDLLGSVRVAPQQQSNIVTITAEAHSPGRAVAIANAFAEAVIAERTGVFQRELRRFIRRLESRLADLGRQDTSETRALADRLGVLRGLVGARDPTLRIASRAVPPKEQSWPRPVLSIAVAVLAGALLGIGIAIALELLSPLVLRDEDVLEQRLPLLARAPRTTLDLERYFTGGALAEDVTDAYRLARVNLATAVEGGGSSGTILVTSASHGEGKTTVAANLALVYAQAGFSVVLVDADVRRHQLTVALASKSQAAGLQTLLLEGPAEDAFTTVGGFGSQLRLVTAATGDGASIDVLQSSRVRAVVDELAAHADVVIFDSPPITEVADALRLATAVDAVVLVVRYGRSRRDRLADALLLLDQLGVRPAGIIAILRRRSRGRRAGRISNGRQMTPGETATGQTSRTRARSSARQS
jgi:capsular exopolysaccharide synthesis family protein